MRNLRLDDDVGQLLRAQKRHRGDDDRTGLDDREPARCQHWIVGTAQQYAIAGNDAEIVDEYVSNAIRKRRELSVAPARTVRCRHNGGTVATSALERPIEQFQGTIHYHRILKRA